MLLISFIKAGALRKEYSVSYSIQISLKDQKNF